MILMDGINLQRNIRDTRWTHDLFIKIICRHSKSREKKMLGKKIIFGPLQVLTWVGGAASELL